MQRLSKATQARIERDIRNARAHIAHGNARGAARQLTSGVRAAYTQAEAEAYRAALARLGFQDLAAAACPVA
jgi:hypothetical protein